MAIRSLFQQLSKDISKDCKNLIADIHNQHTLNEAFKTVVEAKDGDQFVYVKIVTKVIESSPWQWISEYMKLVKQDQMCCVKILQKIVKLGQVPVFKDMEHYKYEENDFTGVSVKSSGVMSLIYALLSHINKNNRLNESEVCFFMVTFLPDLVMLLLEQYEDSWWSSNESCFMSSQCFNVLLSLFDLQTCSDLLHTDLEETLYDSLPSSDSTVLCKLLKQLNQTLTKESWKKYPASQAAFYTCLKLSKFPHLGEHLNKVLPPSLFMTDDYMLENKILGVKCLHKILSEVSGEELRWYGRAEVVYEALKHQMYTREAAMITVLHPALLAILDIVERHATNSYKSKVENLTRYNEVFEIILFDAEGEQNIMLRRALTKHLWQFIDRLGINSLKHMSALLRVTSNYLEIPDGPEDIARQNVLRLLQKLLEVTWPRISSHSDNILKMLVKLLIDLTVDEFDKEISSEVVKLLILMSRNCLVLLKFSNKGPVEEHLRQLCDHELPDKFLQVIQCVLDAQLPDDLMQLPDENPS